jgi:hypothetical protein
MPWRLTMAITRGRNPDGSGANSRCVSEGSCRSVMWSASEYRGPDSGRSSALKTERSQYELPLADAMHQLNARDRGGRVSEPLEVEHHGEALLHAPVVLLNQIIIRHDFL